MSRRPISREERERHVWSAVEAEHAALLEQFERGEPVGWLIIEGRPEPIRQPEPRPIANAWVAYCSALALHGPRSREAEVALLRALHVVEEVAS